MANTPEGTPYVESSDLVANYPAASLALANRVDLVGVLPFANAAARTTAIPTPTDGQYSYLQDTNATEFWNGSEWQAVAGGKILQVVRATDTTSRTTSSSTIADVTGMAVTITPQKSTSSILLIAAGRCTIDSNGGDGRGSLRITDSSNNGVSGAQDLLIGSFNVNLDFQTPFMLIGWASPATTSAVTYKLRFAITGSADNFQINNNITTGQMYAIEVSA